jgi:hypothetical protein
MRLRPDCLFRSYLGVTAARGRIHGHALFQVPQGARTRLHDLCGQVVLFTSLRGIVRTLVRITATLRC